MMASLSIWAHLRSALLVAVASYLAGCGTPSARETVLEPPAAAGMSFGARDRGQWEGSREGRPLPNPTPTATPVPTLLGIYAVGTGCSSFSETLLYAVNVPSDGEAVWYGYPSEGYADAVAAGSKDLVAVLGRTISEYLIGSETPLVSFTPYDIPGRVATDADGTLYVSSFSSSPQSITVYALGSSTPSRQITVGITGPAALATDENNAFYVSNGTNIVVYRSGGSSPHRTISNGIDGATSMAFDRKNRLLVLNAGSSSITIYGHHSNAPTTTITSGISAPSSLAVGPTGTVYVASFNNATITEYDHEGGTVSRTIATNSNPLFIAVDSHDDLYELELTPYHKQAILYEYLPKATKPSSHLRLSNVEECYFGFLAAAGPPW